MHVVQPAGLVLLPGDGLDTVGPLPLQLGRTLGDLVPGLHALPVQALRELLGELPDRGPLGAGDGPPRPGSAGAEVLGAGADGLPEDDLGPLVLQELRVPPVLAQFVEQPTPLADRLVVVDQPLAVAGFGLPHGPQRQLVDVADVHPRQQLLAAERQQAGPQVGGQVLVERGQQHGL